MCSHTYLARHELESVITIVVVIIIVIGIITIVVILVVVIIIIAIIFIVIIDTIAISMRGFDTGSRRHLGRPASAVAGGSFCEIPCGNVDSQVQFHRSEHGGV